LNHWFVDNGAVAAPRDHHQNPSDRQNPHCVFMIFGLALTMASAKQTKQNICLRAIIIFL